MLWAFKIFLLFYHTYWQLLKILTVAKSLIIDVWDFCINLVLIILEYSNKYVHQASWILIKPFIHMERFVEHSLYAVLQVINHTETYTLWAIPIFYLTWRCERTQKTEAKLVLKEVMNTIAWIWNYIWKVTELAIFPHAILEQISYFK